MPSCFWPNSIVDLITLCVTTISCLTAKYFHRACLETMNRHTLDAPVHFFDAPVTHQMCSDYLLGDKTLRMTILYDCLASGTVLKVFWYKREKYPAWLKPTAAASSFSEATCPWFDNWRAFSRRQWRINSDGVN